MDFISSIQEFTEAEHHHVRQLYLARKRTACFEEWRAKLQPNDRLPRGPFFKGKKAGVEPLIMDEYWLAQANVPFDFSHMQPFGIVMFSQPAAPRITKESLARFRVSEGSSSDRLEKALQAMGNASDVGSSC